MRVDADLLRRAVEEGTSTLRFYTWDQPTISLGYFQKDISSVPEPLAGLPVVKRLSGGGAILHHHELTYSIALSHTHPATAQPSALYGSIHRGVLSVLETGGLVAQLRGDANADPANKSFLCFARADPNDIVVGANKVVGSAQRRRKGAILQHGSIVFQKSAFAPQFPGVVDLGFDASLSLQEVARSLETFFLATLV